VKLALDPQMFYSSSSVYQLPDIVASLGYDWMELSPKADYDTVFAALAAVEFDGVISSCVFRVGGRCARRIGTSAGQGTCLDRQALWHRGCSASPVEQDHESIVIIQRAFQ
jgi:sugar phosphate isomerase/epimerase